jgi:hypothetical protein
MPNEPTLSEFTELLKSLYQFIGGLTNSTDESVRRSSGRFKRDLEEKFKCGSKQRPQN